MFYVKWPLFLTFMTIAICPHSLRVSFLSVTCQNFDFLLCRKESPYLDFKLCPPLILVQGKLAIPFRLVRRNRRYQANEQSVPAYLAMFQPGSVIIMTEFGRPLRSHVSLVLREPHLVRLAATLAESFSETATSYQHPGLMWRGRGAERRARERTIYENRKP